MIRKLTMSLALIAFTVPAFAKKEIDIARPVKGELIFDCQISDGELQEARAYKMKDGLLVLTTLDSSGTAHAYDVSSKQFESAHPQVRIYCPDPREGYEDSSFACGRAYYEELRDARGRVTESGWMFEINTAGMRNIGNCVPTKK